MIRVPMHLLGGPEHGRNSLLAELLVPLHCIAGCLHTGKVVSVGMSSRRSFYMADVETPQRSYDDIDLFEYIAFPITFCSAMQDRATL